MASEATIRAGGLEFRVEYRRFGGDQGPAISVFGEVDGSPVQVLRFDCFDQVPHYHYDPDGVNGFHRHDRRVVPDVVAWSLAQLRDNLPAMVKTAGYPQLAAAIDGEAIAARVGDIGRAVAAVTPGRGGG
ncbi:MAG: hypothetical protein AB1505_00475 [Candidatus Latescibacterota bacterium]